jgi:hypothetical protein
MVQNMKSDLPLRLLRKEIQETEVNEIEQLPPSDWDEFIHRSARYGILPLLYQRLKESDLLSHIPDEISKKLREIYLFSAERNMRMHHGFSKALKMLRDNDIPVIVLKGAALSELVYQNIALRPMSDVDLIVKTEDIWKADRLLSQSGYTSTIDSLLSKRHIKWVKHIEYLNKIPQIEIHINKIQELPEIDVWTNATPAEISSIDTLIMGTGDFLLHLCVHLVDHLCVRGEPSKLIRWYDIAEFVRHYEKEMDWDYVIQTTKKNRVDEDIYRVLKAINQWFDGDIPDYVLDKLKGEGNVFSIEDILDYNGTRVKDQKCHSLLSYIPFMSNIPSFHNKAYHLFRCVFRDALWNNDISYILCMGKHI